jgi:predicted ATPase
MKISEIHVEGFRSLRDVLWRPGDLNVVIGPNASGKSNLLKGLEMLSASAQGELAEYVRREGGMESVVWDGTAERIHLRVNSRRRWQSPAEPQLPPVQDFSYVLKLPRIGRSSSYQIALESLATGFPVGDDPPAAWQGLVARHGEHVGIHEYPDGPFIPARGPIPEQETLVSLSPGPFAVSGMVAAYQMMLQSWAVYQDFQTHRQAPVREATISRVERKVELDGRNLVAALHTLYTGHHEFKEAVDAAMRAAFANEFRELVFPPAADQRIQLRVRWRSLSQATSAADLSDGTLRFLFLLAILANPDPPGVIAIDEPETGLHPSMMPIIAEYAEEASRRCQVILTTHSAELLDAFTRPRPTTTVARLEDGQTVLEVRSGEELDYWLQEYTLGRLYRSGELEGAGVPA